MSIAISQIDNEIEALLGRAMSWDNLSHLALLYDVRERLSGGGHLTDAEALDWYNRMTPAARWTMDQTTSLMQRMGYDHDPVAYWVVMDSLASDYGETMAKYGVDIPELWADLAHDWLADADAVPAKPAVYYREIVKRNSK